MSEVSTEQDPQNTSPSPQFGLGDQTHFQQRQQKNNRVLWGIFALLLVLTGGVIFLLPRFVTPPDPASTALTVVTPAAAPAAVTGLSPFEEAQRLRQREAAQSTLAALLELQESLEAQEVLAWAEMAFNSALEFARTGDESYRLGAFTEAGGHYQSGLDILQQLDASKPQVYSQYMALGDAALEDGNAAEADRAYSIALLVNPDSADAVTGMERAIVLDEVLGLLEAGNNLQSSNQFEAAREQYRKAQQLDADNTRAAQAVTTINRAILERDFAGAMSRGFAALQRDEPEAARTAFNQAGALKPGSAEVAAALQQAADQETFSAVTIHMNAAATHEADERWADALGRWNQALEVDPNLVSALDGKRRSESRLNLDTYLDATLADPLRLAEETVFDQARQVVQDARRIPAPGPKLQTQLTGLEALLSKARVPAEVAFQSDGQTTVTLYRISELGMFTSQSLSLLPGKYVAVGVRSGYRDVRQEFTVPLEGQPPVVVVACSELI